jgi:hypothetical protein
MSLILKQKDQLNNKVFPFYQNKEDQQLLPISKKMRIFEMVTIAQSAHEMGFCLEIRGNKKSKMVKK